MDIKTSIDSIEEFLGDKRDFTAYEANKMLKRAIEREFEIIGEAMNAILRIDPEIKISKARRIVNFRNHVIHSYDSVDAVIVWGVIINDLPTLKDEVRDLLPD